MQSLKRSKGILLQLSILDREKSSGAAEVAKRHESAAPPCGAFTACMTTFYLLGSPNPTNKGTSSESYVKNEAAVNLGTKKRTFTSMFEGGGSPPRYPVNFGNIQIIREKRVKTRGTKKKEKTQKKHEPNSKKKHFRR